jgi:outer membrane protein W
MTLAPLLLVTTLVAVPHPDASASLATPSSPAPTSASATLEPQARPVPPPATTPAMHTLAIGGSIVAGSNGATGAFQYWFNQYVGMEMSVGYYRLPNYASSGGSGGYTFQTAPSVVVLLTKPDQTRDVNLRPYLGGGVNYVSSSSDVVATRARTTNGVVSSGTGMQAFGGVEMSFKDTPRVGLSFEAAYYHLPSGFVGTGYIGGMNYLLGVHFYLK